MTLINGSRPLCAFPGYNAVAQANAQAGDIVVFRSGAQVDHSAVLTNVVLNGANFNQNTTMLDSKNGNAPFANQTLAQVFADYPNTTITVYRAR